MKQKIKTLAVFLAIFTSLQISNDVKADIVPAYGCAYSGIGFEICRAGSVYVYNCHSGYTTCGYNEVIN